MAGALRTALVALVILACPSFTAGQPSPQDPLTGVIVGQIVDAGNGRPVGSALVLLTGGPPLPRLPGSSGPSTRPRLMTDGEGRFAFRGLGAGTYNITITKPGYVDGALGRRRPGGLSQSLKIVAGDRIADITIPIWRQASVSGSVVDEAGEPVIGAEVRALRRMVSGARRRFTAGPPTSLRPVTDDRGQYRIPGLTPGDYVVVVASAVTSVPASILKGYHDAVQSGANSMELFTPIFEAGSTGAVPGTAGAMAAGDSVLSLQRMITPPPPRERIFVYPTTYYPAAFTAPEASIVTLGSGEDRTAIDFQLRPVATSRVAGTVTSADGPATNIAITLNAGVGIADTETVAATVTDGKGAFVFPAVPAGQYTLRVLKQPPSPPGERTTSVIQSGSGVAFSTMMSGGSGGPPALPTEPALWATVPLNVGRTDIGNVAVMLQNGPRVTGKIEFEGTSDKPRSMSMVAVGLEGEVPRPAPVSLATIASVPWQVRVEDTGAFTSTSVPGGRYFIRALTVPPGWSFKSATLNGRDVTEQPFDLQADVAGVVITMTDSPIALNGVVRTAAGAPDPDATVLVFPTDNQTWNSPAPGTRRFRSARAGKDGSYTIAGLPAGSYYVVAIPEVSASDWMDPRYLEQLVRLATDIRVEERDKRTLDLVTKEVR